MKEILNPYTYEQSEPECCARCSHHAQGV